MSRFERWFLKRLVARQVRQGRWHAARITALYQLVRDACDREFYEDNAVTRDDFLHEMFMRTQVSVKAGARHHRPVTESIGKHEHCH